MNSVADAAQQRRRAFALTCLGLGLALSLATPAYVGLAAPHLSGYLHNPWLFVWQAVPYLLYGALWLPRRSPDAAAPALVLAGLLLLATIIAYVPVLVAPGTRGGDMVALFYAIVSAGLSAGVLIGSIVAFLLIWLRGRRVAG